MARGGFWRLLWGGTLRNVIQLYLHAARKGQPTSAVLYVDPRALEGLGTSRQRFEERAIQACLQVEKGNDLRLSKADVDRVAELTTLLDTEILSRVDA